MHQLPHPIPKQCVCPDNVCAAPKSCTNPFQQQSPMGIYDIPLPLSLPPPTLFSLYHQIDACLLGNLRNPFVGTVHLLTDHPDADPDTWARRGSHTSVQAASESARQEHQAVSAVASLPAAGDDEPAPVEPRRERSVGGNGNASWGVSTDWRPPILGGLEADLAGESTGRSSRNRCFRVSRGPE